MNAVIEGFQEIRRTEDVQHGPQVHLDSVMQQTLLFIILILKRTTRGQFLGGGAVYLFTFQVSSIASISSGLKQAL